MAALEGSIYLALTLVVMTEALGAAGRLTPGWVAGGWAAACAVCIARLASRRARRGWRLPAVPSLSRSETALAAGVVFVGACALVAALTAPPNNPDAMAYHLSRVMHWIQDRSLAFYPTHIERQLHRPPFAEFAALHWHLLTGGDRFDNLTQFLAMAGSLMAVSLLVERLGGRRRARLLAVVVAATDPMGMLEASSAQTDYVLTFWTLCFLFYALRLADKPAGKDAVLAGLSLGIAALTKQTALFYALPVAAWLLWGALRAGGGRAGRLAALAAVLGLALVVNLPHAVRTTACYGNPMGPARGTPELYRVYGPRIFVSSVARNVTMHLGPPYEAVDETLTRAVYRFHEWLGIDPNDPRTTSSLWFSVLPFNTNEEKGGGFVHTLLLWACVLYVFWEGRSPAVRGYAARAACGFGLFCLFVTWAPHHARLHLVYYIMLAPVVGIVLDGLEPRPLAEGLAAFLLLSAPPFLFGNLRKPMLSSRNIFNTPRSEQYFAGFDPGWSRAYLGIMGELAASGCRDIGLELGDYDREYPFWAALNPDGRGPVRLEHVNVRNASARLGDRDFCPCRVVRVVTRGLETRFSLREGAVGDCWKPANGAPKPSGPGRDRPRRRSAAGPGSSPPATGWDMEARNRRGATAGARSGSRPRSPAPSARRARGLPLPSPVTGNTGEARSS